MHLARARHAGACWCGRGAGTVLATLPSVSLLGIVPVGVVAPRAFGAPDKGTQRNYLMKEELVAGAHGVEGRYPFLDPNVVQELWVTTGRSERDLPRMLDC